jgi:putative oxidoreductase
MAVKALRIKAGKGGSGGGGKGAAGAGTLDLGLLVLRLGMGLMFVTHGWPKMLGGPEKWEALGGAMAHLGVDFGHQLFGLAAALAEFLGGVLLALGLGTRVAALFLLATMVVAATMHLAEGDGLKGASHAIEAGVVFAALALTGAGRFSVDRRIRG